MKTIRFQLGPYLSNVDGSDIFYDLECYSRDQLYTFLPFHVIYDIPTPILPPPILPFDYDIERKLRKTSVRIRRSTNVLSVFSLAFLI